MGVFETRNLILVYEDRWHIEQLYKQYAFPTLKNLQNYSCLRHNTYQVSSALLRKYTITRLAVLHDENYMCNA